jgi:amidohydrolase
MKLIEKIKELAIEIQPKIISFRRYLHQHPELSFQEYHTIAFIKQQLIENNISCEIAANTGLTGIIVGKHKSKHSNKHVFLRADIDALPIQEENNCEYASVNKGIMHACGHDVHSASLFGSLLILKQLENEWSGSVRFVFQPGEEVLPGGASLIINEGWLEKPKPHLALGQHVFPDLPSGKVGFRAGMYMASSDEIHIILEGKGGHAALPHLTSDLVAIAAQIIVQIQHTVSRFQNPVIPAILTFGSVQTEGGAVNVIPKKIEIKGTFRTLDEFQRERLLTTAKQIAENIAAANDAHIQFNRIKGYPVLINNPEKTAQCKQAAANFLGIENVIELALRLTAEDFAFYTSHAPSVFYRLGTNYQNQQYTNPVHTPTFDIDENALITSTGLMAYLTLTELNQHEN